ncbi:MAG: hypothetical protein R3C62_02480 [Chloroflexota bacterium]
MRIDADNNHNHFSAPSRPSLAQSCPLSANTWARRPGDNANRVACATPGHPAPTTPTA